MKNNIVRDQPCEPHDFHREEISPEQNCPVCADKVFPGDSLLSVRRRRNAMTMKDITYGLIGQRVA
jgi:hypothetical protein